MLPNLRYIYLQQWTNKVDYRKGDDREKEKESQQTRAGGINGASSMVSSICDVKNYRRVL